MGNIFLSSLEGTIYKMLVKERSYDEIVMSRNWARTVENRKNTMAKLDLRYIRHLI